MEINDFFMYPTHGGWLLGRTTCLGGATLGILEGVGPRWHGDTRFLEWRLMLDLRTMGLRNDHVGGVDPKVHMA
jgi:hypothetical protein